MAFLSGSTTVLRRASVAAALVLLPSCAAVQIPTEPRGYYALGNDPGWTLEIGRRIKFAASPGNTYVEVPSPALLRSVYGRRYATDRIIVDMHPAVCIDSRSGLAFEDTVQVTTSNLTVRGCGGKRVPLLDGGDPSGPGTPRCGVFGRLGISNWREASLHLGPDEAESECPRRVGSRRS
jgi:uncharacterized membrane protein